MALRIHTNRTTAEPSFSSDSPSMSVPSVFAAPSSLSRATTATGSVAEAMMPMSQHTQNVHVGGASAKRQSCPHGGGNAIGPQGGFRASAESERWLAAGQSSVY